MPKQYTLLSSEPLDAFAEEQLRLLQYLADEGVKVRSAVTVVLTEEGESISAYHSMTMEDMLLAKGWLEQDIQRDHILENLPYYIRQAREEGLLDEDYDEEYRYSDTEEEDEDGDTT